MTDHPTSVDSRIPIGAHSAPFAPAPRMVEEWKRLAAFLRRPTLSDDRITDGALTVLGRIFALDILAMFALIIAASIAVAAGIYIPETALAGIEFTLPVIALVVIGAPLSEELLFRGWLSGKPGALLALLSLGIGTAVFAAFHATIPYLGLGAMALGALGALAALILLRNHGAIGWFRMLFPLFFWLTAISFALVHLWNFDEGSLWVLLPLVLPQFILGMLLGYVRVRIGLWSAILLHAAHNSAALSIAALAMMSGA